jgi:serine/threonine protein kinase
MCSGFPQTDKSPQPPQENSSSRFSQSNILLNNRYRILKPLGQGGFGKTFLSIDEQDSQNSQDIACFGHRTPRLCVIKQFLPQCQSVYFNQKSAELFHQETLRLAELGKHPQIPQLLDTFEEDGKQYLVQEWVDGQTLEQEFFEVGAFNEVDIRELLGQLLPVLQFVHTHQVIHRDIKLSNIIRRQSDRQLFLVDFGAAKYTPSRVGEEIGTMIGSAEYAAPEQIRGQAVFASDLYSLGVTCLHLLTQMSPFELYDCSEDTWIWRSYLIEPISPSLEKILCKLVQPAIKRRYHFAAEALIDLNNSTKQFVDSSGSSVNANTEDDFETPFFGLSREENLPAFITPTVFNIKTQSRDDLPAKTETAELAQKVAAFLGPRLAAAAATPPVREKISSVGSQKTTHKSNKIDQIVLTAIAFTVACLAWAETNSNYHNLTAEISKTFQQFFDPGKK